ncbi:MAG: hypothetical protein OES53_05770 [Xanthomonadales bacterium]|nr:hypothetical protein [Xanthomonadales bacterium]MDH3924141.1 hypothetical protein [Xanthomonadales bacterium]
MTAIRTLILGTAILASAALTSATCLANFVTTVNGGGIIKEGAGTDENKITFSLNVYADDDVPEGVGHFQAQFHRLALHPGLEKSRFFSRDITGFYIGPGNFESTPNTSVKIWASGRLDREDGWSVIIRFADFGNPKKNKGLPQNHVDAVRIQLVNPNGEYVYDTAWEAEFSREQGWRHLLDGGNISVHISED